MIPKIIWQTYKTAMPPTATTGQVGTWVRKNPLYEWYYFDDDKCDQFIKDHFDASFYNMYQSLPVGVMKSDVWRVAIVYVYGGIYADLDTECLVSIDEWLPDGKDLVVYVETPHGALSNFTFAAAPKHPALYAVLQDLIESYNSPRFLHPTSPTPVQDFGAHSWSHGILKYYGLDSKMELGAEYYNKNPKVVSEKTYFYPYDTHMFSGNVIDNTVVWHRAFGGGYVMGYDSWREHQYNLFGIEYKVQNIKFITTFSESGYNVYGRSWINSFLNFTKDYHHISAKIYVEGKDTLNIKYNPKIDIVEFNSEIPNHKRWVEFFKSNTSRNEWSTNSSIKFSFKSFVMIDELEKNNRDIVIWLDADSVFVGNEFDNFPFSLLGGKFMAIQKEQGSDHCESGIVIFDASHKDKDKFLTYFKSQYSDPKQFNTYPQFFDGFALHRSITNTEVSHVDLNEGYGVVGIQSDPSQTFLNPELRSRFLHNIGASGKRNYEEWERFANTDVFFQLIHGINDRTQEEIRADKIKDINAKISRLNRM